ncbi:MAG: valine--tRNA ligase [SAR324 cluster bacterium]|nr:valine--tRNA ligase [SAR324 cluster bacterium]
MAADRYNPADFERRRYDRWLEEGRFAPAMEPGREPFCIVIPPPNVTGSLHMGHAWDETLQDVLIRWKRMQGYNVLWIPGMDHAGIATQWMVERALAEKGLTKEQLGREKFIEEVWRFKETSHETIANQLKRLGVSCDWERERFTLDAGLSRAVRRVFVTLYREGLIYRDNRMVSWCPRCLTALSDLEVNHEDVEGGLWHIRYPFAEGNGHVIVATTRPETMLGDTAVAVHPEDERYRELVGRSVILPLVDKTIPLIADSYVDPEFGSGALKITPGHDPNDFEIGRRHGLPIVTVMNEDGTMNGEAPPAYRGLDRFEARRRVVADLEVKGLLERYEKHAHAIGTCSRCATVVEPRVSLQWFVSMKELAEEGLRAVESKRIELLPEYQEKIYFEWMNNIQDWCISRQLWWGHRIPVWYCKGCGETIVSDEDVTVCDKCGGELEQDADVLDTWFSSGLWPFSSMGWPEETEDLKTFYPTSVLVTGYDILFFWVARMIVLGLKFMGEVPFGQVFLHGLLRDEHGEKMSKTKGNGIDPLDVIEEYGTDALRFTLAAQTAMGRDIVLQKSTIEGYRNFINKIWNAHRFLMGHWERLNPPPPLDELRPGIFDRWILGRLQRVAQATGRSLEQRRFNDACREIYAFVWHEYCDWYLEIVKPVLYGDFGGEAQTAALATLRHVLGESLKLLHPFMPFVTEELWERLPGSEDSIMVQPYPEGEPARIDARAVADAQSLIEVIGAVRGVRGENLIKPKQKVDLIVATPSSDLRELLRTEQAIFAALAGTGSIQVVERLQKRDGHASAVGKDFEVFLSFEDAVDAPQERERLGKELEKTRGKIVKLAAKLDNPNFVEKAPPEVVVKNREELGVLEAQAGKLTESLAHLPSA